MVEQHGILITIGLVPVVEAQQMYTPTNISLPTNQERQSYLNVMMVAFIKLQTQEVHGNT